MRYLGPDTIAGGDRNGDGRTTYPDMWVAYVDAYGFSAATDVRPPAQIDAAFVALANCLEAGRASVAKTYQFSDSIFVLQHAFPDPLEKFQALQSILSKIQSVGLDFGLAFRGSVSFGAVTIGPYGFFSTAIVRAARLESQLLAPLVALPQREILRAAEARARRGGGGLGFALPTTPIPTKTGAILGFVMEPPLAKYLRVADRELTQALISGPDHVVPAWQAAISLLKDVVEEMEE